MSDQQWYVGQTVLMFNGQERDSGAEVEITRVGRSVVGVQVWGREMTFRMSDGIDSKHGDKGGPPSYILTKEQLAYREERRVLVARLRELGVRQDGYGDWRYPNEVLAELVEVLEKTLDTPTASH